MNSDPRAARRSRTPSASILLLGALSWCGTTGCQGMPEAPGRYVEVLYQGNLDQVQPIDVVVTTVLDESGSTEVPKQELRKAFYRTLPKRRYSPISLEYVDNQVVEASYRPGLLGEDAVLQVTVRGWDTTRWRSHAKLTVDVEAWMQAPADGSPLWGGRLQRTLDLRYERDRHQTADQALRLGCRLIAEELLEMMPAHNPAP